MADYINSPNMSLPVPVVGTAPGPDWASLLNSCLAILDQHSHVNGSGVPITPSAININSDLTMASNNLTNARSLRLASQVAALALTADVGCLYEVGNDLYYNDGAGNQIRLTQAGSIVGTAGSITGLPSGTASAAYTGVGATFVWQSATSVAANMDFGSAVMRNTSPNSTFALTLSPPAGLGANYALTLPSLPVSTRVLSLTSLGVIAAGVAQAVQTADLADVSVTAAKIADSTITGGKLVTNIALPGKSVTAGGLNVVVNAEGAPGLKIIRGTVSSSGGSIISGSGFTVSRPTGAGTGVYLITFDVGFLEPPTVLATPAVSAGTLFAPIISAEPSATGSVKLNASHESGGNFIATDMPFSFMAIALAFT